MDALAQATSIVQSLQQAHALVPAREILKPQENQNRPRVSLIGRVQGYEQTSLGTLVTVSDVIHPKDLYRCLIPNSLYIKPGWLDAKPEIEFHGTLRRGERGPVLSVEHIRLR